jgi:hypothetical protein
MLSRLESYLPVYPIALIVRIRLIVRIPLPVVLTKNFIISTLLCNWHYDTKWYHDHSFNFVEELKKLIRLVYGLLF